MNELLSMKISTKDERVNQWVRLVLRLRILKSGSLASTVVELRNQRVARREAELDALENTMTESEIEEAVAQYKREINTDGIPR